MLIKNLSNNTGVHASLHSYCHHQIVHSSFNPNIRYPHPPPTLPPPQYQKYQQIRDCQKADSTNIRKALDLVNWEKLFDQKDLRYKLQYLMKLLNVFWSYVPSKYIAVNKNDPVWKNENILFGKILEKRYLIGYIPSFG